MDFTLELNQPIVCMCVYVCEKMCVEGDEACKSYRYYVLSNYAVEKEGLLWFHGKIVGIRALFVYMVHIGA